MQNKARARSWGCKRNKIFEKGLPVQELGPRVTCSCGRPDWEHGPQGGPRRAKGRPCPAIRCLPEGSFEDAGLWSQRKCLELGKYEHITHDLRDAEWRNQDPFTQHEGTLDGKAGFRQCGVLTVSTRQPCSMTTMSRVKSVPLGSTARVPGGREPLCKGPGCGPIPCGGAGPASPAKPREELSRVPALRLHNAPPAHE